MISLFRRRYGAGPLHLLSFLACFALAGYVVHAMVHAGHGERILVWFVAAVLGHDLVLFPLYTLADRSLGWVAARQRPRRLPAVPWINYLRVPVVICFMLLAVSFPLVLGRSPGAYRAATGLSLAPFEGRYLLVVGVVFAVSAVAYALRLGRAAAAASRAETAPSGESSTVG